MLSQRIDKNRLLVTVASGEAANNLLKLNVLAGIEVDVTLPLSYYRNLGKLWGVPLEHTNEQLVEYLRYDKVVSAQRQMKYIRREDGYVAKHPYDNSYPEILRRSRTTCTNQTGIQQLPRTRTLRGTHSMLQCYNYQCYMTTQHMTAAALVVARSV